MQTYQFADQHQADSASRHFLINGIAAPEKPSAQIFPLPGGNSNPRITYLYAPCILFSVGTNMDITIRGVYFKAFDNRFFNMESILSLSNQTFIKGNLLSHERLTFFCDAYVRKVSQVLSR